MWASHDYNHHEHLLQNSTDGEKSLDFFLELANKMFLLEIFWLNFKILSEKKAENLSTSILNCSRINDSMKSEEFTRKIEGLLPWQARKIFLLTFFKVAVPKWCHFVFWTHLLCPKTISFRLPNIIFAFFLFWSQKVMWISRKAYNGWKYLKIFILEETVAKTENNCRRI